MISNIWRNRTSIFFSEINTSVVLESLTSNASGKCDVHFLFFFLVQKRHEDAEERRRGRINFLCEECRLLPITAGICQVTYQGNGKYLTFNFLTVR